MVRTSAISVTSQRPHSDTSHVDIVTKKGIRLRYEASNEDQSTRLDGLLKVYSISFGSVAITRDSNKELVRMTVQSILNVIATTEQPSKRSSRASCHSVHPHTEERDYSLRRERLRTAVGRRQQSLS